MAIKIGSNFQFNGKEFLDARLSIPKTTDDLKNWSYDVPEGFEVSLNGNWYIFSSTLPSDSETGKFHKRFETEEKVIAEAYNDLKSEIDSVATTSEILENKYNSLVAETFNDLINPTSWVIDGIDYARLGIQVCVTSDPDSDKIGIYSLRDSDYTQPTSWRKVSDDIVVCDDTEPQDKGAIWIDSSKSYTPTTVNEDVAGMIGTLQKLQNKVDAIDYAFTHEIGFGDFTNNLKAEVTSDDQLEPGTTRTSDTTIVPKEDGTVDTITSTTETNTKDQDGVTVTTTTTTTDVSNSSGNSVTTIGRVVLQTSLTDDGLVVELGKTETLIITKIINEADGSKTTFITTTTKEGDKTESNESATNILNVKNSVSSDEYTEKTVTTYLDPYKYLLGTWEVLDKITILVTHKTIISTDKTTTTETTTETTQFDNSKVVVILTETRYQEEVGGVISVTQVIETKEYDYTGKLISDSTPETKTYEELEELVETYTPNAKHLRIKMGTYAELLRQKDPSSNTYPFLSGELLFCYDKNYLYIISPVTNAPVLINGGGSGGSGGSADLTSVDEINFNAYIDSLGSKTKYTVKVGRTGNLICYPKSNDNQEAAPLTNTLINGISNLKNASNSLYLPKLYINSVYCGGITSDKYSYNYCSHNFVELSNLTGRDVVLDGISLQYAVSGTDWKVLPLTGVIKSGGTFLIRGAQCSVMDVNTTLIKVPTFDMEWYVTDDTTSPATRNLITFSNTTAKFLLIYGSDPCGSVSPYYYKSASETYCEWGYIDSVGLDTGISSLGTIDGFEKAKFPQLGSGKLLSKYYSMDPVSQATKAIGSRDNSKDWYYVNLETANPKTLINGVGIDIKNYQPKSSSEGKDIFYNKTHLDTDGMPEMVSVMLGIEGTDSGEGATRCFNWVSKDYHDEFLWYRRWKVKDTEVTEEWTKVESFKESDFESRPRRYQYHIYDRQRVVSTSEEAFTSHKYVLPGLKADPGSPVTYQYRVGRDEEHASPIYTFVVKNSEDVKNFSFVQVSDQQGFNRDEYKVWEKAANCILKWENDLDTTSADEEYTGETDTPKLKRGLEFFINTGDMTQNGNRLNEWLDYYNSGVSIFSQFAQMNIIGNNDLCPKTYQGKEGLGLGNDVSKINGINFQFFYTNELDPDNLPYVTDENKTSYYIHSLYSFNYGQTHFLAVNSEITGGDGGTIINLYNGVNVYAKMKEWCENDLKKYSTTKKWTIAYCHEMPFTIITDAMIDSFNKNPDLNRGGSHLNTVYSDEPYWFSRLLENYGVPLCLGGHKHTYSCSKNIRENYSYKWTGEVKKSPLGDLKATDDEGKDIIYKSLTNYPRNYVANGDITLDDLKYIKIVGTNSMVPIIQYIDESEYTDSDKNSNLAVLEKVSSYNAPIYVMDQATGYKQTSNKELPAGNYIPWLSTYFPATNSKAAAGQKYPFYIRWDIAEAYIRGSSYKINNIMTSGSFSINSQNTNNPNRQRGNGSSKNSIIITKNND